MFGKRMLGVVAGATMALGTVLGTTAASAAPMRGHPEVAYGAVYGHNALVNNPVIPLTYRGLVDARGVFLPGNGPTPAVGQHRSFFTTKGTLWLMVSGTPSDHQTANSHSCLFTDTVRVPVSTVPWQSTGRWHHVRGDGMVTVYFQAYGPRYPNGYCNMSNSAVPLNRGALASFFFSAQLRR